MRALIRNYRYSGIALLWADLLRGYLVDSSVAGPYCMATLNEVHEILLLDFCPYSPYQGP